MRLRARSRSSSWRVGYWPDSIRWRMSEPVGALVSKSRAITASNCSRVSNTVKSSSGEKLLGKTRRPRRLTRNGFIAHILPAGGACLAASGKGPPDQQQYRGHAEFARAGSGAQRLLTLVASELAAI